jgi:hypothetical protein
MYIYNMLYMLHAYTMDVIKAITFHDGNELCDFLHYNLSLQAQVIRKELAAGNS